MVSANFQHSNLSEVDFEGADMTDAKFTPDAPE